jgi:hypothetical protein
MIKNCFKMVYLINSVVSASSLWSLCKNSYTEFTEDAQSCAEKMKFDCLLIIF